MYIELLKAPLKLMHLEAMYMYVLMVTHFLNVVYCAHLLIFPKFTP